MTSPSNNITPLILTYNEEPNLKRTLEPLTWANQILIVDSFSTDETLNIAHQYPQVKVLQRTFDSHANQWNYGLQNVPTPWVLALDADYVLSNELVDEIKNLDMAICNGYKARFTYCVQGKPLRGTLYPDNIVLFKINEGQYYDDGHTQRLQISGALGKLSSPIYHDDRKGFSRWLQSQDRYMIREVDKLLNTPSSKLSLADRLRKTKVVAPFVVFFYCLFVNGVIVDGWRGWFYTLQRVLAEMVLTIRLIEAEKLSSTQNKTSNS
jgi:glycosyltransferase involved in cell wall biosynthesis